MPEISRRRLVLISMLMLVCIALAIGVLLALLEEQTISPPDPPISIHIIAHYEKKYNDYNAYLGTAEYRFTNHWPGRVSLAFPALACYHFGENYSQFPFANPDTVPNFTEEPQIITFQPGETRTFHAPFALSTTDSEPNRRTAFVFGLPEDEAGEAPKHLFVGTVYATAEFRPVDEEDE